MRLPLRGVAIAWVVLAIGLGACGKTGGPHQNTSDKSGMTIGLLLPEGYTARYGEFDRPLIEKKIESLCGNCRVVYANAQGDTASQKQQVNTLITQGVRVLIIDPVDFRAARSMVEDARTAGIPVVAYDRLAEGPISGYVSFDNEQVGRLQGEALLKAMGTKANGGQIVMMNGDPTTPNVAKFKDGALSVLKGKVRIGRAYDTQGWKRENAFTNMSRAIDNLGADKINGVYAANDSIASGVISALKAAHITPLPPVTGQDADLVAVQRIVSGEQYMSIYKPFKREADTAADMAIALGRGEGLKYIAGDKVSTSTARNVPAVLLTPIALTVHTIKATVVKDGVFTIDQICTPKYKAACERAGLTR